MRVGRPIMRVSTAIGYAGRPIMRVSTAIWYTLQMKHFVEPKLTVTLIESLYLTLTLTLSLNLNQI